MLFDFEILQNYTGIEKYDWHPLNSYLRHSINFLNVFMLYNVVYVAILFMTVGYYTLVIFVYRKPELITIGISALSLITDFIFPDDNILLTFIALTFYLVPIALLPISMDFLVREYESGIFSMALGLIGFIYGSLRGFNLCMHIALLTGLSSAGLALSINPHMNSYSKGFLCILVTIYHFLW